MPRMTPAEKRALLAEEHAKLAIQMRALDKKIAEGERKKDTRRKIIMGAITLEHLGQQPNDPAAKKLRELAELYVEERDRHLFPFLPARPANSSQHETAPPQAAAAE